MIPVHDALRIVLDSIRPLGAEEVSLTDALHRTLAQDIVSPDDIPCYDNSAMDGYAVIASDLARASRESPVILQLCEEVPAGKIPQKEVTPGRATRIMTGAPIPRGANAVVMVEATTAEGEWITFFERVREGDNIRAAGEDVKKGEVVLRRGHLVRPQEMGLLASMGFARVPVFRKPRVAILSTGDEVIEYHQALAPGHVRNSNAYALAGLIQTCGGLPVHLGIARDTKEALRERLLAGLEHDMIVASGGVSVGDYDYVKDVLADLRWELKFWQVALKPGKPVAFGLLSGKPVFGLSGNPSGAMLGFELFVRPALLKMQGRGAFTRLTLTARLEHDLKRKPGRKEFIPAVVTNGPDGLSVHRCGSPGSGVLKPLCQANAYIVLTADVGFVPKGAEVQVQFFEAPEME